MTTHRETVRARRAEIAAHIREQGVNVDDLAKEARDPARLNTQVLTMGNESMPRQSRERLIVQVPVAGAFDGSNTEFTIDGFVAGMQIAVIQVTQATGAALVLTRTSNPAPASGSFYFDGVQTIRMGDAPAASDNVIAAYISTR